MSRVIGTMVAVSGFSEGLQDFEVQSYESGFERPLGAIWWGYDAEGNRYEVPMDCYVFKKRRLLPGQG